VYNAYCFRRCSNNWKPTATRRQNPMLGAYNTRSATTKPTGKKRFDAGINGNTINARLCNNNQTSCHPKPAHNRRTRPMWTLPEKEKVKRLSSVAVCARCTRTAMGVCMRYGITQRVTCDPAEAASPSNLGFTL